MSLHSMDIGLSWPISATQDDLGDYFVQHRHMHIDSMGIDSPWPISSTQGDHRLQHRCMSLHSMGIGSPWPISTTQGDHRLQHMSMPFILWASVCPDPYQQLKVPLHGSISAGLFIPRYTKLSQVFHHLKMPIQCCMCNYVPVQHII
jgi:hypothetical protein